MAEYDEILTGNGPLGPYPDHLLKRVDRPTVAIPGPVEQRTQTDNAAIRVRRGSRGEFAKQRAMNFTTAYPLGPVISEIRNRMVEPRRDPSPAEKRMIPDTDDMHILTRHLKAFGYFLGADAIGVCRVPETAFYADDPQGNPLPPQLPTAMVFLKRGDPASTGASSGGDMIVDPVAQQCYLHLTLLTEATASYIRQLGWSADANNLRHFNAQMPPLVLWAGLGEACRIGISMNPFFGADFKVSAVLTDMPLETDKPIDFGLQDYCARCGRCAKVCPGGAISPGDKQRYNGYDKWLLDAEDCFAASVTSDEGTNCFRCILNCPWARTDLGPEGWAQWDGSIETLHAMADAHAAALDAGGGAPLRRGRRWWLNYRKPEE